MATCTQAGSSGGGGAAGEPIPLPGQVVMAEYGRPAGQDGRYRVRGGRVEGQRAQILDDHHGGVTEGVSEGARVQGWRGTPSKPDPGIQTGNHQVDGSRTGHGTDFEAERPQGPLPFLRLDRNPVRAAQPEADAHRNWA